MENAKTETYFEEQLFNSRTIFISGQVDFELAQKVNAQLIALENRDKDKPIILWINSPGGEVYSGFSIYDTAQFIQPQIITVIAGMAMSMGSVISLAAEKKNRFILSNSKILIHQPLIGGTIQGPASDIVIHAQDMQNLKEKIYDIYSERTGTSRDDFVKLMDRDYFISPEEAIKLGLVSKIIKSREELDSIIKKNSKL